MNKIFKDAYEGSWSDQVVTDITVFFHLDAHEKMYILLRLAFDHPFLAVCLLIIIFAFLIGFLASTSSNIEAYNSATSRQTRLREKIENHNKTKTIIDSRTKYENEIKNIFGGLFFGFIFFLVVSVVLGRVFSYIFTAQQGWVLYLMVSIVSYIGVRKYKIRRYNKFLALPDQEHPKG